MNQPKKALMDQVDSTSMRVTFRSQPRTLSIADVKAMLKKYDFFDSDWNKDSLGFNSRLEEKFFNDKYVIQDHLANLMWQQGGSISYRSFTSAKEWIMELNVIGFAGFNDWRLPTLEEAMSLVKPEKIAGLHIDRLFDRSQEWIWTSDLVQDHNRGWIVYFFDAVCFRNRYFGYDGCVRAVRSVRSEPF